MYCRNSLLYSFFCNHGHRIRWYQTVFSSIWSRLIRLHKQKGEDKYTELLQLVLLFIRHSDDDCTHDHSIHSRLCKLELGFGYPHLFDVSFYHELPCRGKALHLFNQREAHSPAPCKYWLVQKENTIYRSLCRHPSTMTLHRTEFSNKGWLLQTNSCKHR